jgi:hypothetical protein
MPINTELIRDGQAVKMPHGWGMWHCYCLFDAASKEDSRVVVKKNDGSSEMFFGYWPNNPSSYTYKKHHRYIDETDGEVFDIFPGDIYSAWR